MLNFKPTSIKIFLLLIWSLFFVSCQHNHSIRVAQEIDEPKHSILNTLVPLLESSPNEHMKIDILDHNYADIDSLKNGAIDFFITDNNGSYNKNLSAVAPLFPEILHILHKKDYDPKSLKELFEGKKVYAGKIGSSEYKLCQKLISDFGLNAKTIKFSPMLDIFKSDVIILFTDLVKMEEIRDLKDYKFYSLDDPDHHGNGTIADAISIRNPGLTPFIIPKSTYANYNPEATLTLMSESILICRTDMDEHIVYEVLKLIKENKQLFYNISPLMHLGFSNDFEKTSAVYPLHRGTINYLGRSKPSFLERHSNLLSIIVSLLLAMISGVFTWRNYNNHRKKDNIDVYYQKLENIRQQIPRAIKVEEIEGWEEEIRSLESETINMVIEEKLNANESYIVYMNMISVIREELKAAFKKLA